MTFLFRVDARHACFGFEVTGGVVGRRCAPIARWMIGKPAVDMVAYWRRRGATVTWEAVA